MARLRVVLVEDGTFPHGSLRQELTSLDLDVVAEGSDWASLLDQANARSADAFVVVGGADPHLFYEMAPGERAVVVVADGLSDVAAGPAVEHGAFAFVPFPIDGPHLHLVLRTAVARAADMARLQEEVRTLQDQLQTRKLVERAKGILMDRLGLSEHDAFRKLQKASQDENRKMREIADSVIRAEKMFGAREDEAREDVDVRRRARPAS
ncbi:MAG: ANTAR domain-containing response regulator [bacterium]